MMRDVVDRTSYVILTSAANYPGSTPMNQGTNPTEFDSTPVYNVWRPKPNVRRSSNTVGPSSRQVPAFEQPNTVKGAGCAVSHFA